MFLGFFHLIFAVARCSPYGLITLEGSIESSPWSKDCGTYMHVGLVGLINRASWTKTTSLLGGRSVTQGFCAISKYKFINLFRMIKHFCRFCKVHKNGQKREPLIYQKWWPPSILPLSCKKRFNVDKTIHTNWYQWRYIYRCMGHKAFFRVPTHHWLYQFVHRFIYLWTFFTYNMWQLNHNKRYLMSIFENMRCLHYLRDK